MCVCVCIYIYIYMCVCVCIYIYVSLQFSPNNNRPCLVSQRVKRLLAMQETEVRSLGREDHLEKEMATHSSILA